MTPALETLAPADCEHGSLPDWRSPPEIGTGGWCGHGIDENETFAPAIEARRSIRKLNAVTPARSALDEIIEASRAILELELDEDEAQAPYTEETWTRAVEFLRRSAKWVSDTLGLVLDLPKILPGPDGSIDLHWDYSGYETLINIPADPNAKAGFYGDDRGESHIKGSFDPRSDNYGLLLWLAKPK